MLSLKLKLMLKFNKRSALEALKGGTLHDFFNAHFVAAVVTTEKDPKSGIFQLQALSVIFEDEQLNDKLQHWQYQSKIAYKLGEIHHNLKQIKEANQYFKQSMDIDFEHDALPHPFTAYLYAKTLETDFEPQEKAYIQYIAIATKHSGEMSEHLAIAMEDTGDFYAKHKENEKALEVYGVAPAHLFQIRESADG
jgi:tetratricopeptide (TPR) repeat protein